MTYINNYWENTVSSTQEVMSSYLMNHPAQSLPTQDVSTPAAPAAAKSGGMMILLSIAMVLAVSMLAAQKKYYSPGDDFGYYLGVAGGSMMLLLLLYPLRKHFRLLQPVGAIRHWFRLHMILGIMGPLLIIVHSAYGIGSLNAAVAIACMLLVAGSGVVGRFMYVRIHHGLYGRKATLQEMQQELGIHATEVRSKFHFAPSVDTRLKAFGEMSQRHPAGFLATSWHFVTLGLRAQLVRSACRRELRNILGKHAAQRQWDRAKLNHRLAAANDMIRSYLDTACHAAQFTTYVRLFSLWHILHVPFVFMLVISGIVHVIAVHMY